MKNRSTEQVAVEIYYRMSLGQWNTAENTISISISSDAYNDIAEELKDNCWSMDMACSAGKELSKFLTGLARLQGYSKITSWDISLRNNQ